MRRNSLGCRYRRASDRSLGWRRILRYPGETLLPRADGKPVGPHSAHGGSGRFQRNGRCEMMTSQMVSERVCELFRHGLQVTEIDIDTPLLDYGLDSVRSAELVIDLELAFGIEISDAETSTLHTARAVIDCVSAKIGHTTVRRAGVGA
ncbi:acyl carrier protein [Nocardia sp. GCM10030253]|uniref:acyl carrier protein n=1 Tax=Nocardia sp. GCM10030253 TaxID=3273404 RepID=UPI00362D308C